MKSSTAVILSIFLFSCSSRVNILKPDGESANITVGTKEMKFSELLAISDSLLYLRADSGIMVVPLEEVNKVFVNDYQINPGQKAAAAIIPLLIEFTVMLVAFDVDQPAWGMASLATMGVTIFAFTQGGPDVTFRFPWSPEDVRKLRLFCRYPQGLDEEQWRTLLRHYDQEDFLSASR